MIRKNFLIYSVLLLIFATPIFAQLDEPVKSNKSDKERILKSNDNSNDDNEKKPINDERNINRDRREDNSKDSINPESIEELRLWSKYNFLPGYYFNFEECLASWKPYSKCIAHS